MDEQEDKTIGRGPLKQKTDEELVAEWRYWHGKVQGATSWGAAVAAAHEFYAACSRELSRRGIVATKPEV